MVKRDYTEADHFEKNSTQCPRKDSIVYHTGTSVGEKFDWSTTDVSIAVSSYFYTYTLFPPLFGIAVEYISPTKALILSKLIHGGLTVIIPFLCPYGVTYVIISRALMGVTAALTFPATFALLKIIIGKSDLLSSATNSFYTMMGLGTFIAPSFAGLLCGSESLGGWPMSFYVAGGLEIAYVIVLITFIKFFLSYEKNSSREIHTREPLIPDGKNKLNLFIDWKVYGIAYSYFTFCIGQRLIAMMIPEYISAVIHYPILQNGLLNSFPPLMFTTSSFLSNLVISFLVRQQYLTPKHLHSLFFTVFNISLFIVALCTQLIGCNGVLAIELFAMWSFFNSVCFTNVIAVMSQYDERIGIVSGIVNSFGNGSGVVVPMIVNFFIAEDVERSQNWYKAFFTIGVLSVFGSISFNLVLWIRQTNTYLLGNSNSLKQKQSN